MLGLLISSLFAVVVFMCVVFAWAQYRQRYDLIDVAWGVAFITIAINAFIYGGYDPMDTSVQVLVLALVLIWGVRLSTHIFSRWRKSSKEDRRYAYMRASYARAFGGTGVNMFVRVYLLQAVLSVIVSTPVLVVMSTQATDIPTWAYVGVVVWAIGFYFEAVGDSQLRAFLSRAKNKGKLMTEGVWRYTRHPNYFGEIAQWWGIFIIALSVALALWWLALIGPAVITALLLFVSGVPLTEKHFEGRSGWSEYKRRTSKLIPLPPKATD